MHTGLVRFRGKTSSKLLQDISIIHLFEQSLRVNKYQRIFNSDFFNFKTVGPTVQ